MFEREFKLVGFYCIHLLNFGPFRLKIALIYLFGTRFWTQHLQNHLHLTASLISSSKLFFPKGKFKIFRFYSLRLSHRHTLQQNKFYHKFMVNPFASILPRFCCQRADQHGKSPTFLEACQQRNRLFPNGYKFCSSEEYTIKVWLQLSIQSF